MVEFVDNGLLEEERGASGGSRGLCMAPTMGDGLVSLLIRLRSVEEEEERVMTRPVVVRGKEVVGEGGSSLCSGIIGCSIPQSILRPIVVGEPELDTVVVVVVFIVVGILAELLLLVVFSMGIMAEAMVVGGDGSTFAAA